MKINQLWRSKKKTIVPTLLSAIPSIDDPKSFYKPIMKILSKNNTDFDVAITSNKYLQYSVFYDPSQSAYSAYDLSIDIYKLYPIEERFLDIDGYDIGNALVFFKGKKMIHSDMQTLLGNKMPKRCHIEIDIDNPPDNLIQLLKPKLENILLWKEGEKDKLYKDLCRIKEKENKSSDLVGNKE